MEFLSPSKRERRMGQNDEASCQNNTKTSRKEWRTKLRTDRFTERKNNVLWRKSWIWRGKKTKGRKRHIVTDTMGNLLCIHVHAANIHDTKGGVYTFEKALYRYPTIQAGCADGGYRGTFRNTFDEFHNIRIDISMQIKEQKGFQVLPKRWVVERTFAWLNGSRRLSKDYETSCCSAETMIMISHAATLLNRLWTQALTYL